MERAVSIERVNRIIWAVDPFAKDRSLQRAAANALSALTAQVPAVVEPVYLFDANFSEVSVEVPEALVSAIRSSAEEELAIILTGMEPLPLSPLKVLVEHYHPMRMGAETMAAYATSSEADLIVLSTRARTGPMRWLMGSFAENLVSCAEVPLFVVNPEWNQSYRFKHILFATDFSIESLRAFRKVVKLAKLMGSDLSIFHHMPSHAPPLSELVFSSHAVYYDAFREEAEQRTRRGQSLVDLAAKQGVYAEFSLDQTPAKSSGEMILSRASQKPGIIAMVSHSGPVTRILLGSTTRQVIRSSVFPVWVMRAEPSKLRLVRAASAARAHRTKHRDDEKTAA
jgi:nucleotide-binding universal stress UspA family protein